MIELYKDGDKMAIKTEAPDEREFMNEMCELLARLIEKNAYPKDWYFQLLNWLDQVVDICCKYRGYKNQVEERRILIAGSILAGKPTHVINKRKEIAELRAKKKEKN